MALTLEGGVSRNRFCDWEWETEPSVVFEVTAPVLLSIIGFWPVRAGRRVSEASTVLIKGLVGGSISDISVRSVVCDR